MPKKGQAAQCDPARYELPAASGSGSACACTWGHPRWCLCATGACPGGFFLEPQGLTISADKWDGDGGHQCAASCSEDKGDLSDPTGHTSLFGETALARLCLIKSFGCCVSAKCNGRAGVQVCSPSIVMMLLMEQILFII